MTDEQIIVSYKTRKARYGEELGVCCWRDTDPTVRPFISFWFHAGAWSVLGPERYEALMNDRMLRGVLLGGECATEQSLGVGVWNEDSPEAVLEAGARFALKMLNPPDNEEE